MAYPSLVSYTGVSIDVEDPEGMSSFSWQHNVTSVTDGYLIVHAFTSAASGGGVSGVTFNGDTLTYLGYFNFDTPLGGCWVYGLANPDVGNYTVEVTLSGVIAVNEGGVAGSSTFVSGVNQTNPHDASANKNTEDTSITIEVTTDTAQDFAVDAVMALSGLSEDSHALGTGYGGTCWTTYVAVGYTLFASAGANSTVWNQSDSFSFAGVVTGIRPTGETPPTTSVKDIIRKGFIPTCR
jgi:hypothetical protein